MLIVTSLFCEEWEFIVIQDTPIYWSGSDRIVGEVGEGRRLVSNGIAGVRLQPIWWLLPEEDVGFTLRIEENWDMAYFNVGPNNVINAKDIRPANSIELFGFDILATYNNIVISYTLDILRSTDRKTLFRHEPFFEENQQRWEDEHRRYVHWYEEYNSSQSGFFVTNAVLGFGDRWALLVGNIERTVYGYRVRSKEANRNFLRSVRNVPTMKWGFDMDMRGFDLLIHIDGDYIDLYINSTENRIGTFVSVPDEFIRQFNNLIRTNTVDLSRITSWPRRADGTMDFPPPGIDMSGFETSHATTARLRVRDSPATDSPIVTTLDAGAEVQVLETGPAATIGDVTAPWVRLLAVNGFTGWAFSGFLESTASPAEPEIRESPAPVPQNDAASTPMPLWSLLAIVGAAVVVVGGAVLFAIRRKV